MHRFTILAVVALSLISGLTACTYAPRYDDHHGSSGHDYFYYPHVGVYFHLYSGHYYYRDGRSWVRVRVLPPHIFLDHRVRRRLVIKEAEPYRRHAAHRESYRLPHDFKRDRKHDRAEREYNRREHQKYRKRSERPRPQRY